MKDIYGEFDVYSSTLDNVINDNGLAADYIDQLESINMELEFQNTKLLQNQRLLLKAASCFRLQNKDLLVRSVFYEKIKSLKEYRVISHVQYRIFINRAIEEVTSRERKGLIARNSTA